jgi:hypothetical protein
VPAAGDSAWQLGGAEPEGMQRVGVRMDRVLIQTLWHLYAAGIQAHWHAHLFLVLPAASTSTQLTHLGGHLLPHLIFEPSTELALSYFSLRPRWLASRGSFYLQ